MNTGHPEWEQARTRLVNSMKMLGFPEALGNEVAKHLGSPKAMERMNAYLMYVKPRTTELVVDEMLAIRSEIDAWRDKKQAEEANMKYNELLYYGLDGEEESDDGEN